MKGKLGTDNTYWKKTEAGIFSCLFQIFGFTWPHLSVHIIIPKGKWRVIQHISITEWTPLPHSMLERKFTVQTILYIKALTTF